MNTHHPAVSTMHLVQLIVSVVLLTFSLGVRADAYRFAASELRATVRHPFKVIVFSTKKLVGRLEVDLNRRQGGIGVQIDGETLTASESGAKRYLQSVEHGDANIRFASKQMQLSRGKSGESGAKRWDAKAHGELTIFGNSASQSLELQCVDENRYLSCTMKALVSLERFSIPPPSLLGVKGSELVEIEGDLTFAPEEGS